MSTPSESVFQPTEVILPERWRMPLEVCEKVIDEIPFTEYHWRHNRALRACALVCRAWVPRSRICLYRKVILGTAKEASRFTTTICSSSTKCSSFTLGQLVYSLYIVSSEEDQEFNGWIRKAFQALPSLLTNLYKLEYDDLPVLHPSFHLWSSKFTTVKSLSISSYSGKLSFREVVQIVNAFKNLEKFEIFAEQKNLGLCYWKQSYKLKFLSVGQGDRNSHQDVSSWLLKDNGRQINLLKKLSLNVYSDILGSWRLILENYAHSLQSLNLKIWNDDIGSQYYFPSLCGCSNLKYLFISDNVLRDPYNNIAYFLQALSQSLPYSLQVLSLYFYIKSIDILNKDIRDLWQKLDTTLSGSKYSNLQHVQIFWTISQGFWQDNSIENISNNSELEEKTEDSKSIQQLKFKNASLKDLRNKNDKIKDELSDIDYSNIFLDYFPYLYKNKLLLCGDYCSSDTYLVSPAAFKLKILKTKNRLQFNNIEIQL